ncbi:MAG: M50 family metallopeptidase [Candidatus Nealsonbacteria bacterium]
MILTIIVALFSLVALMVIHEFGHFIIAKKFGVKVEEFGIGYPPRIFGKKFGETIYSLNLIPFGAFVKIYGEEGGIEDYRSFTGLPIWKRILIVLGGVISFWVISFILLSFVSGIWGLPTSVEDTDFAVKDPKVQIAVVASGSPANMAEIQVGDVIYSLGYEESIVNIDKVQEVQDFISLHKGEEISLGIKRGDEVFEKKVTPRINYPENEGSVGIGLTRIALKNYSWYQAPLQGAIFSWRMTKNIVDGWILGFKNLTGLTQLPEGVKMELLGPLGIFDLLREYFKMGINYFLFLVSFISIALALFNILPIPALDGGKLVFLVIEKIKGKPINPKIEQNITALFFILLIVLLVFVTIRFDIPRFF